ncbi:S24 family peptidase [Polymorphobacter fuscus]|uniref:Peptidase S24 n=1 Tax=Sandarakinorhabdus fusca TaxID=1439888 RepID=A0A7C9GXL9_9SPHN|nr:S24 family peptidase [Polymorphobacter fuscus]KAB7646191.1 helix-turn-helix transcriptional regulator [Polymorphobacter fuscus]MQT17394.1 peptidase S24 [Polymorphobacter fuscus]NJC10072.1 phage repressor protein C with HTH and peptisase S24 domain [Polymorphobacter fuscus]
MDSIAIRKRLDELIASRGEDYASLSRRLGRNPTYIQQFVKRGVPRRLSETDRRVIAQHFGIAERLLGGPDDNGRAVVARPDLIQRAEDYVLIPRLAIGASAGSGAVADDESPLTALAFQSTWVRSVASGNPAALSVISVTGDSMLPTLADGDQILVDTADRERLRDGIYVLRTDDALLVKRLSVNPATRRLAIRSDNDAYPSWDDCDPAGVNVIGRVVWVGRRLV